MAVLSTCRNFRPYVRQALLTNYQPRRPGGGGHGMVVTPTTWMWNKFKDMVHFYTLLVLIPAWTFAAYMNLTRGPAVLAETPEGYRPEFYEYQKHPITRWLAYYFFSDPQIFYEAKMGRLNWEFERVMMNRIKEQVQNVMMARNDYEAWFYWPFFRGKFSRRMRETYMWTEQREGINEPHWFRERGWLGGTKEGYGGYENPHGDKFPTLRPDGLFKWNGKVDRGEGGE